MPPPPLGADHPPLAPQASSWPPWTLILPPTCLPTRGVCWPEVLATECWGRYTAVCCPVDAIAITVWAVLVMSASVVLFSLQTPMYPALDQPRTARQRAAVCCTCCKGHTRRRTPSGHKVQARRERSPSQDPSRRVEGGPWAAIPWLAVVGLCDRWAQPSPCIPPCGSRISCSRKLTCQHCLERLWC